MDFKEIKQIVELMDKHGLSAFDLDRDGNRLSLKKASAEPAAGAPPAAAVTPGPAAAGSPTPQPPPVPTPASPEPEKAERPTIKSPMVGTFYRKPSPDAPEFIKVGDKITDDTVICIVEAMKVMNEIKAEVTGTITRILVEDSTPVQYGEPLFEFQPA